MKRIFALGFFAFFGVAGAMAQASSSATATVTTVVAKDSAAAPVVGPALMFEEQKFDFGEIKQGEEVQHTFKFTNNGSQPLLITNVRTTCGCTATDYPKAPVQPGETASITAKFNSAGKRGPQNKVITIESNAAQGSTQVMIVTNVVAPAQ